MSPRHPERTVWVPGHRGWQGQQGSTGVLAVLAAVLGLAVLGYAVILFSDAAPAMKLLGVAVLVVLAVSVWLTVEHLRVTRTRVVRATAAPGSVTFGATPAIVWPLRLLGLGGVLLLAAWLWAILTVPADRLSILTIVLLPVVAVLLVYGGARAWLRRPGAHALTLTPERLTLRIPRNHLDTTWDEVSHAALEANRVAVHAMRPQPATWGARDLASDPVILADLVTFYAQTPAARGEIGDRTLDRLQRGELPAADAGSRPPTAGKRHH